MRRREPPVPVVESASDDWLIDRRVRLYCMFHPGMVEGGQGGVTSDEEYEAFEQLGPKAKRVINEDCVFKWSCIDIVREMNERGWDLLADDRKIARELLRKDESARGYRYD